MVKKKEITFARRMYILGGDNNMEYKVHNINVDDLTEETLQGHTKDGWELVSVVPKYETEIDYTRYSAVNCGKSIKEITVLSKYSLVLKK